MNKLRWWGIELGYENLDAQEPTLLPYAQRFPGIEYHFKHLCEATTYAVITEEDSDRVQVLLEAPGVFTREIESSVDSTEKLEVCTGSLNFFKYMILKEVKKTLRARYELAVLYVDQSRIPHWAQFLEIDYTDFHTIDDWLQSHPQAR